MRSTGYVPVTATVTYFELAFTLSICYDAAGDVEEATRAALSAGDRLAAHGVSRLTVETVTPMSLLALGSGTSMVGAITQLSL